MPTHTIGNPMATPPERLERFQRIIDQATAADSHDDDTPVHLPRGAPDAAALRRLVFDLKAISLRQLEALWRHCSLHGHSLSLVLRDPYAFCSVLHPVLTFRACEKVAEALNLRLDQRAHTHRLRALVAQAFRDEDTLIIASDDGHPCQKLCAPYSAEVAALDCHIDRKLVMRQIHRQGITYQIPLDLWELEQRLLHLVRSINGRQDRPSKLSLADQQAITDAIYHVEVDTPGLRFTKEQRDAIETILSTPGIVTLTGKPGTGKTTAMKAFARLASARRWPAAFMATAGMAVSNIIQNIAQYVDPDRDYIATIFRCTNICFRNEDRLDLPSRRLIVVDEASMVNYLSYLQILQYVATHPQCQLVLVGDPHQLPPIGVGHLFHDLVAPGADLRFGVTSVNLTEVKRQDKDNPLSHTINAISDRTFNPDEHLNNNGGCLFYECPDSQIPQVLEQTIAAHQHITHLNCLVLTAQRKGPLGAPVLSRRLQKNFGIPRGEPVLHAVSLAGYSDPVNLYPGDKLQRLKNDYSEGTDNIQYNGDFYCVEQTPDPLAPEAPSERPEVGPDALFLLTNEDIALLEQLEGSDDADDHNAETPQTAETVETTISLRRLRDGKVFQTGLATIQKAFALGYCTSIHKSQGSQADYVVLVIPEEHRFMWNKCGIRLLYTAISRAKKQCICIGSRSILLQAYQSDKQPASGLSLGLYD